MSAVNGCGRGLFPTPTERQILRVSALEHGPIADGLTTLGTGADLSGVVPFVFDQRQTETCWAHSAAMLKYIRECVVAGSSSATVLSSPLFYAQCLYATYREEQYPDGQFPAGVKGGLLDVGAALDDAIRCFTKWGSVPCGGFANGASTDVPITVDANGNPIPLPELGIPKLETGQSGLFGGPYDLQVGAQSLDACQASLDNQIPVWTGGLVGQAYQALQAGELAQPCDPTDPTAGGHAQGLVGYKLVSGSRWWKVINSWGSDWANGGYAWASDAWVASMWQLIPFLVNA